MKPRQGVSQQQKQSDNLMLSNQPTSNGHISVKNTAGNKQDPFQLMGNLANQLDGQKHKRNVHQFQTLSNESLKSRQKSEQEQGPRQIPISEVVYLDGNYSSFKYFMTGQYTYQKLGHHNSSTSSLGSPPPPVNLNHKNTTNPPQKQVVKQVSSPQKRVTVDHIQAAAELDKESFLKTLTALSNKVNLFTNTFYTKQPNFLFPQEVMVQRKISNQLHAVQNKLNSAANNGDLKQQKRIMKLKHDLECQQMKSANNNMRRRQSNRPAQEGVVVYGTSSGILGNHKSGQPVDIRLNFAENVHNSSPRLNKVTSETPQKSPLSTYTASPGKNSSKDISPVPNLTQAEPQFTKMGTKKSPKTMHIRAKSQNQDYQVRRNATFKQVQPKNHMPVIQDKKKASDYPNNISQQGMRRSLPASSHDVDHYKTIQIFNSKTNNDNLTQANQMMKTMSDYDQNTAAAISQNNQRKVKRYCNNQAQNNDQHQNITMREDSAEGEQRVAMRRDTNTSPTNDIFVVNEKLKNVSIRLYNPDLYPTFNSKRRTQTQQGARVQTGQDRCASVNEPSANNLSNKPTSPSKIVSNVSVGHKDGSRNAVRPHTIVTFDHSKGKARKISRNTIFMSDSNECNTSLEVQQISKRQNNTAMAVNHPCALLNHKTMTSPATQPNSSMALTASMDKSVEKQKDANGSSSNYQTMNQTQSSNRQKVKKDFLKKFFKEQEKAKKLIYTSPQTNFLKNERLKEEKKHKYTITVAVPAGDNANSNEKSREKSRELSPSKSPKRLVPCAKPFKNLPQRQKDGILYVPAHAHEVNKQPSVQQEKKFQSTHLPVIASTGSVDDKKKERTNLTSVQQSTQKTVIAGYDEVQQIPKAALTTTDGGKTEQTYKSINKDFRIASLVSSAASACLPDNIGAQPATSTVGPEIKIQSTNDLDQQK